MSQQNAMQWPYHQNALKALPELYSPAINKQDYTALQFKIQIAIAAAIAVAIGIAIAIVVAISIAVATGIGIGIVIAIAIALAIAMSEMRQHNAMQWPYYQNALKA